VQQNIGITAIAKSRWTVRNNTKSRSHETHDLFIVDEGNLVLWFVKVNFSKMITF